MHIWWRMRKGTMNGMNSLRVVNAIVNLTVFSFRSAELLSNTMCLERQQFVWANDRFEHSCMW